VSGYHDLNINIRLGIQLIQETSSILFVEDSAESPWLLFEWLDVLNLDEQDIARLSGFDVEWTRQIMNLS
jgi:hypothetical protein